MGASTVFVGDIWNSVKETLETIVDDDTDGYRSNLVCTKWMDEKDMSDHWEDDLEMGGLGLAAVTPEGTDIPTGTIREGYIKRYIATKFGIRISITKEAMKDKKYERAIRLGRRCKRALYKTLDIDCTDELVFGFDANFPGGDGLPLWSASHTLPHGGTWSNVMATAMSPSRAAVVIATSQIKKFPGHDGVIEGYMPKQVLCPTEQWAVWEGLVKSTKAPEPGAFNEINVVNGLFTGSPQVVPNIWWNNTTTNWAIVTDADNGFNLRWRDKPESNTWVENSNQISFHSHTARWARGYSDARCSLGVQA